MTRPLILVVDDQPCVAQAARLLLEYAGMDVLVANSPAEATAIWQRRKSDIALLMTDFDLEDPVDGERLAQRFQAERPNLRSLVFSAYPLDELKFPGRIEGVDFFQKPWNCGAVISAVQWLLRNEEEASPPSTALAC
ncbi:MAG: response regulator [Verrucomicrobiales bacterium]|nr:response regulator [Verrucomicrobiales bacterium]